MSALEWGSERKGIKCWVCMHADAARSTSLGLHGFDAAVLTDRSTTSRPWGPLIAFSCERSRGTVAFVYSTYTT